MTSESKIETKAIEKEAPICKDFITFINNAPSHFHAVATSAELLTKAGFQHISEKGDWKLKQGGRYFFTRNQSSIVAFAVGNKWKAGNGFTIIGAHTDSPVLKVKPISKVTQSGFQQVGIEPYGGGLWYTWFDRDLSLAGRVIVAGKGGDGKEEFHSRLVQIKRPILRIPSLAIHLNRELDQTGFNPNKQQHVLPILASSIKAELEAAAGEKKETKSEEGSFESGHHPLLLRLLAEELKVEVAAIKEFELCLYDTQPATLGGALNEFIFSRALDNLMMSFVSLRALIDNSSDKHLAEEDQVRMVALFDNEEVGSSSTMGAASSLMPQLLRRINGEESSLESAIRKSFLVSADMAHGLHPNYADKHEPCHRPQLHKGLVIKQNSNQRYATSSLTSFILTELAKRHNLPVQKFVVRNDTGCGSTIGPILATSCGIRTVDVGVPQWSMHSIRETCGTADVAHAYHLLGAFFNEFGALDRSVHADL